MWSSSRTTLLTTFSKADAMLLRRAAGPAFHPQGWKRAGEGKSGEVAARVSLRQSCLARPGMLASKCTLSPTVHLCKGPQALPGWMSLRGTRASHTHHLSCGQSACMKPRKALERSTCRVGGSPGRPPSPPSLCYFNKASGCSQKAATKEEQGKAGALSALAAAFLAMVLREQGGSRSHRLLGSWCEGPAQAPPAPRPVLQGFLNTQSSMSHSSVFRGQEPLQA